MANRYFPEQKPANSASRADYYKEGKRQLRRAIKRFPDEPPLEALVLFLETEQSNLSARSARKYRCDHARIARVLCRRDRIAPAVFEAAMSRIDTALGNLGRPRRRVKATDTTREEVVAMFNELKRLGLSGKHGWRIAATGAFYAFVVPSIGIRPVELLGSQLVDTTLFVQTAKRQEPEPDWRPIPLTGWPEEHLEVLEMLIVLAPQSSSRRHYKRWESNMAEAFARACERAGVRRISPYSLRHAAFAIWEATGFTPEEIAALAGHLDIRSARRHYARASSAWRDTLAGRVAPPSLARSQPAQALRHQWVSPAPLEFDFDDFPQPTPNSPQAPMQGRDSREDHARRKFAIVDGVHKAAERTAEKREMSECRNEDPHPSSEGMLRPGSSL